jgi:eukaryotic-like serine/threonine-protein kinase
MKGIDVANECPADDLEGMELPDGWVVGEKVAPKAAAGESGGHFSVGYEVSHPDLGRAFLKALDLSGVLRMPNSVVALQQAAQEYNYECDILEKCKNKKMSRVVVAIARGEHRRDGDLVPVPYLIFEPATCDVRKQMDALAEFDAAWALGVLHHIAIGIGQLHGQRIAHQDVKPSNVLMFGEASSKLGDLGRAEDQADLGPLAHLPVAGDPKYAPPELLYGEVSSDWEVRRLAPDLYLLGSLVLFFFAGTSTTHALIHKLPEVQRLNFGREPFSEALPFLRDAFDDVVRELEASLKGGRRDRLVEVFRELCDPDPAVRGHYAGRFGSRYSMRRYVSKFDVLSREADSGLIARLAS